MVMIHELAHNKQMNHSKAFWAVRNEFSNEMKALWANGYTGDGLWGRGVLLENGLFANQELGEGEVLPEHMCGGTFRSRGKKRMAKPKITHKEQQERRIRKKFGVNGVALGADEEAKVKLEKGKKPAGKPRVAGSMRGRELRAAAALARFEVKAGEPEVKDEDLVTDSEAESDAEDIVYIKAEPNDAIDIDGQRIVDSKGRGMVKVCEDEDKEDEDAKNELLELQSIPGQSQRYLGAGKIAKSTSQPATSTSGSFTKVPELDQTSRPRKPYKAATPPKTKEFIKKEDAVEVREPMRNLPTVSTISPATDGACPVCSVLNERTSLTCMVCSNVLKVDFVAGSWHCKSAACKDSQYINAGDVGVCGVCSTRKDA